MPNRINQLFEKKQQDILNIYFTAGHPTKDSIQNILTSLAANGVDLIELGMPYSDPMADGPTIQQSSEKALANGVTLEYLFEQVTESRLTIETPIIMMGYYNQMMQYGEERFLATAQEAGVDGLIIPDLPMDIYERDYLSLFQKYNITISFLVTPNTSDERILQADRLSSAFLYVVAQSSITGADAKNDVHQEAYFKKLKNMSLKSPQLIGFGIHDQATFNHACQYANGAIIGSAFIRYLEKNEGHIKKAVGEFVRSISNHRSTHNSSNH